METCSFVLSQSWDKTGLITRGMSCQHKCLVSWSQENWTVGLIKHLLPSEFDFVSLTSDRNVLLRSWAVIQVFVKLLCANKHWLNPVQKNYANHYPAVNNHIRTIQTFFFPSPIKLVHNVCKLTVQLRVKLIRIWCDSIPLTSCLFLTKLANHHNTSCTS